MAAYGAEMRVIATFFGLYAPDALPSYISVFSHDFKRLDRFTKLATSSYRKLMILLTQHNITERLSGNKAFIREDLMSYEGQG